MRIHYVLLLTSCVCIAGVSSAEPNAGDEMMMMDGSNSGCSWGSGDAGSGSGSGSGSDGFDWTRCDSVGGNAGSSSGMGSRSGSGSEDFGIDAGASASAGTGFTGNEGSAGTRADQAQSGGTSPSTTSPQKSTAPQIAQFATAIFCVLVTTTSVLLA